MTHKKYEKLSVLRTYGELGKTDEQVLMKHLESCPRCAEFSMKLGKIKAGMSVEKRGITEANVAEARNSVRVLLTREQKAEIGCAAGRSSAGLASWKTAGVPVYSLAAAAFLVFAAGVTCGYFLLRQNPAAVTTESIASEISAGNAANAAISNVRFLTGPTGSGNIRFTFELVRRCEVSGSLEDKNLQKILAFALVNSDNPGVRLRTIGALDASSKPDTEIEDALIGALRSDDNAGVRRKALASLESFPFDSRIKNALLFVLQNDRNPGLRVSAINILAAKGLADKRSGASDPEMINVLRERSTADQNMYVRTKARDILKELKES